MRREDYIAPGGVSARAPVTEIKAERPSGESRKKSADGEEPSRRPEPTTTIKLAPMPQSVLPPVEAGRKRTGSAKAGSQIAGRRDPRRPIRREASLRASHEARAKAQGRSGRPATTEADRAARRIPQAPPAEETGRERSRRGPRPAAAKAAGSPDEFATSLGGREARQLIRKRTATPARKPGMGEDEEPVVSHRRALTRLKRTGKGSTAAPRKGKVVLQLPATVRSFSEAAGVSASQVLRKLIDIGFELGIDHDQRRDRSGNGRNAGGRTGRRSRIAAGRQSGRSIAVGARQAGRSAGNAQAPPAGHHVPGPRRPRQDVAVGQDHRHRRGQRRKRRHHAAHPRLRDRKGRAGRSRSSIRRATRRLPRCAPAAPMSPTSPCWSSRPTTASCRKPKKPSAMPGRPTCRSSWR